MKKLITICAVTATIAAGSYIVVKEFVADTTDGKVKIGYMTTLSGGGRHYWQADAECG